MRNSVGLIISILLMTFLVGCQQETIDAPIPKGETPVIQATAITEAHETMEPYIFKTSEPGMVTLRGVLLVLDPYVMLPDPNDAIFLVPLAIGEAGPGTIPSFTIGEVPQADVDERTGDFVFTNIQPGQYAVVVLVKGGSQIPAHNYQSNSLAILKIEDKDIDTTIDLGYLSLP